MQLYEWEGKAVLREGGIHVPQGYLVSSPGEAIDACRKLGGRAVLKAQVRQGGRGKAGLIRVVTPAEAGAAAAALLAARPAGERVGALLVEEVVAADAEWYAAITMDEFSGKPLVLASLRGGVDVEDAPPPPARIAVDPRRGLFSHDAVGLWRSAGLRGLPLRGAAEVLVGLYRIFASTDALLVEVNPLMSRGEEPPIAADARVIVDDNSLFRHPHWREALLADPSRHPLERRAASLGITYVDLEGDIAVISGGAGSTMALLDAIQHAGGRPANFLDTAGGSGPETMQHMVDIVLEKAATDERVRSIVLNVTIAGTPLESFVRGAVAALSRRPPRVPIFGCVRAASAATQTMSLAEGTTILQARGVRLFGSLREAVLAAVSQAREVR